MREPVVAAAHGQEGRRETVERDGFLFQVADLRPGLDHLAVGIGLVVDGDIERVEFVSGRDRRDLAAVAVLPGDRLHDQFERHIAVVVGCLNGCFTRALDAELGVYRVVEGAPAVEYVAGIRQPGAEVLYPGRFTLGAVIRIELFLLEITMLSARRIPEPNNAAHSSALARRLFIGGLWLNKFWIGSCYCKFLW